MSTHHLERRCAPCRPSIGWRLAMMFKPSCEAATCVSSRTAFRSQAAVSYLLPPSLQASLILPILPVSASFSLELSTTPATSYTAFPENLNFHPILQWDQWMLLNTLDKPCHTSLQGMIQVKRFNAISNPVCYHSSHTSSLSEDRQPRGLKLLQPVSLQKIHH